MTEETITPPAPAEEAPAEEAPAEEKPAEEAPAESGEETPAPIPDEKKTLLEKTIDAVKSLKEQNDRFEGNLKEMREMQTVEMLSGKSLAGQQQKTQEEKEIEEANEILKGTGLKI